MMELTPQDLRLVVARIPEDVRALMKKHTLLLAGGFIRATVAREHAADIDLFGPSEVALRAAAKELNDDRGGRAYETKNALTVAVPGRLPVQFITRWTFADAAAIIAWFDFTIARAAVWREGPYWRSACADSFYADLAARRLVYAAPADPDAGGSVMRMRKFLGRGYQIPADSLAALLAALMGNVRKTSIAADIDGDGLTKVLTGLLREVDPLIAIDGIDPGDVEVA